MSVPKLTWKDWIKLPFMFPIIRNYKYSRNVDDVIVDIMEKGLEPVRKTPYKVTFLVDGLYVDVWIANHPYCSCSISVYNKSVKSEEELWKVSPFEVKKLPSRLTVYKFNEYIRKFRIELWD